MREAQEHPESNGKRNTDVSRARFLAPHSSVLADQGARGTERTLVLVGSVCAYGEEELAGVVDDDKEEEFEDVVGLLGCAL